MVGQPVTCSISLPVGDTLIQPFGLINLVIETTLADTAQGTWGMGYPTIQYQRGMSVWRDIASIPPSYVIDGGSDGKYLTSQPDTSFVFLDTYPENVITEDSTFKNGGLFQIRLKLEVFQNWYPFYVYSNTLSIQFDEIPTDELAALELVRQNIALEDCLINLTSSIPDVRYTAYPTLQ